MNYSFWGKLLRLNIYMFAFLMPLEGIIGRVGLGFFGGLKILGLLIASSLVLAVLENHRIASLLIRNLQTPISVSAFLFTIWNFVSVLWAPNVDWALLKVFTYTGLFVVMQSIGLLKREHIKRMWEVLLLGAALSVPLGFILPAPTELIAASERFTSGGKDPNDYANLIVVTVGVVYYGILVFKSEIGGRMQRFFLLSSIFVATIAIPLSLSRTAIINLLAMVLASFLMRRPTKAAMKLSMLLGLALVSIVILSPSFTDLFPNFTNRIIQRFSPTELSLYREGAWAGRIDIWRAALTVFAERPFTGVGAGNFAFVSPDYSHYAALNAATREDGGGGVAHNIFLSVMSETGLVGLILFGTLLISAYTSAWRLVKRGENLGYGLLIGLLAYTVAGLTLTWEYVKIPYVLYGSLLALRTENARRA